MVVPELYLYCKYKVILCSFYCKPFVIATSSWVALVEYFKMNNEMVCVNVIQPRRIYVNSEPIHTARDLKRM